MKDQYRPGLLRLARCLRVLSALCLVVLALAVFRRPLDRVLGPKLPTAIRQLDLPQTMRPSAKGFMVRVVSEPGGAQVAIDGAVRGSTPLFANVPCTDGQTIEVVVEKQGHPAWRRSVPCRVGGELTVQARLGE
ncbi:MAG: PEGA domain-containing protein [Acidobacteriota bacterium]